MDTGGKESFYLPRDILDLVDRQAERFGESIAFEDTGDLSLSYRDVAAKVRGLGASLAAHGVQRGSRVAIVLPNGVAMALALLGVSVTAIAVPFNPAYRREEFRSYFETIRVGFLMVRKGSDSVARKVAAEMGIKVLELSDGGALVLPGTSDRADAAAVFDSRIARPEPDDIAAILMTSGSTGRPKKVLLTHRNYCASAAMVSASLALGPNDRCLCVIGQYQIAGLSTQLTTTMHSGGTVIYAPGFDAAEFYRLVALKSPTWIRLAPAMMHELISYAARNPVTTRGTSLRLIRSGGAAVLPPLMAEMEALFGIPVIQSYGMTESTALLTSVPLPPTIRKPGSSGPSWGVEIGILGQDGDVLPAGEVGEVAARGDTLFAGYEDDPEATAEAFRGGWYHTGDLGYLDDDGHLFLKGRLKQMINRGGEKVNPHEVDDVLMTHPAVAQVASFAVKHRTLGEDVAAAVVLEPPASVTEPELRGFVAERLAPFKVPQRVIFLDRMPLGATGKIDRLALAEMAEAEHPATAISGPASELESRIAAVWAAELGLESVHPDGNFFAIGGDSLSGVRVFLAVEKAFGKPLPERALMDITTVREMARLIEATESALPEIGTEETDSRLTETEKRSIAVVMAMGSFPVARPGAAINAVNTGGSRKPLFWCFNAPGKDMARLARYLNPEQPLYGLFSGGKLFPKTDAFVAKIAEFYAGEIISLHPDGPYVLGGDCHGARVVIEIAKVLTASGRVVEKFCLLEYSSTCLYDFDGQMLLMFAKRSRLRAYRAIRWGWPGWRTSFRRPPVVEWVPGPHGVYDSHHVISLARKLDRFLTHGSGHFRPLASFDSSLIMAMHRIPMLFRIYRKICKFAERVVYGKSVKLNWYTGEPEA